LNLKTAVGQRSSGATKLLENELHQEIRARVPHLPGDKLLSAKPLRFFGFVPLLFNKQAARKNETPISISQ